MKPPASPTAEKLGIAPDCASLELLSCLGVGHSLAVAAANGHRTSTTQAASESSK
jgi:hypothetical protein